MDRADHIVAAVVALILVGVGIAIGYMVWGTQYKTVVEGHATPIVMGDGSLVLSREPDGKTTVPEPERPKNHIVIRTIEVTAKGLEPVLKVTPGATNEHVRKTTTISDGEPNTGCYSAHDFTCPPVTVRVDLLRSPDGTLRAQASTKDGEILDGVDIPKEPPVILKKQPWVVGYERNLDGVSGAFVQRDIGRLVIGGTVNKDSVSGRIGFRF